MLFVAGCGSGDASRIAKLEEKIAEQDEAIERLQTEHNGLVVRSTAVRDIVLRHEKSIDAIESQK